MCQHLRSRTTHATVQSTAKRFDSEHSGAFEAKFEAGWNLLSLSFSQTTLPWTDGGILLVTASLVQSESTCYTA